MRSSRKIIISVLAGVLFLLAFTAGSASARSLRCLKPDTTGCTPLTNSGVLTFESGVNVVCSVTKILSIHKTIAKVERTLAGIVRDVRIDNCTEGEAHFLEGATRVRSRTVNWHVQYRSYTGTLPTITKARLLIPEALFGINALSCVALYGAGEGAQGEAIVERGSVERVRANEEVQIRRLRVLSDPFRVCPAEGVLKGTLTISPAVNLDLI